MASEFVMSVHRRTAETMKKAGAAEVEIIEQLKQLALDDDEIYAILQPVTQTELWPVNSV